MKIKHLFEVFDTQYNWKWTIHPEDDSFDATAVFNDSEKNEHEIDFYSGGTYDEYIVIDWLKNARITYHKTDINQLKIISTILNIIEHYINIKNPEVIKFSVIKTMNEPVITSKEKLYSRLIKKFAGKMGYSYRINSHPPDISTDFILIKN